jgi:hypothetical protein
VGKYKLSNLRGNHLISTLAVFVFVPSVFGENIPTAEFKNDIWGNCLLGHRKKIAKFLMRSLTCRALPSSYMGESVERLLL